MCTRVAICAVLAACCGTSAADTLAFDTMTTFQNFSLAPIPNTILGEAFSMSGQVGAPVLTGVDVMVANNTGATINGSLRLTIYLWNHASLATSGTTPAFSDLVRTEVHDFGPLSLQNGLIYFWQSANPGVDPALLFSSPVTMGGTSNLGISFRWQVDSGSGFVDINNLTPALRVLTPPDAGTNALGFGYYRNTSGLTDGNFLGSDARQVTANANLGFRLFAAVPAPSSLAALIPLLGWGARRRRS